MKTCLIVDDSRVVRRIARRMLEDFGFSCQEAENGRAAQAACAESGWPGVIFLDWNMPEMNGLSFLKWLRASPGGNRTKVVFCTTETAAGLIQKAIAAGADEYIMKPFDKDIVEGKLSQIGVFDA